MYDDEAVKTDLSDRELPGIPYRAKIWNTPTALTDDVYVTIGQIETGDDVEDDPRPIHKHGPCLGWDKNSAGSFPQKGDKALVFIDDQGDYWITAWSH